MQLKNTANDVLPSLSYHYHRIQSKSIWERAKARTSLAEWNCEFKANQPKMGTHKLCLHLFALTRSTSKAFIGIPGWAPINVPYHQNRHIEHMCWRKSFSGKARPCRTFNYISISASQTTVVINLMFVVETRHTSSNLRCHPENPSDTDIPTYHLSTQQEHTKSAFERGRRCDTIHDERTFFSFLQFSLLTNEPSNRVTRHPQSIKRPQRSYL